MQEFKDHFMRHKLTIRTSQQSKDFVANELEKNKIEYATILNDIIAIMDDEKDYDTVLGIIRRCDAYITSTKVIE